MKSFVVLIKRYRWLAVVLGVVGLWLIGYSSLTFTQPETEEVAISPENIDSDKYQPQAVLAQEEHATDDAVPANLSQADTTNERLARVVEDEDNNCRLLSKPELKAWYETELKAIKDNYESSMSKLNIESVLHTTEPNWWTLEKAKLSKTLKLSQDKLTNDYNRLVEQPEC